ncbi:HAD family phosphatase [Leptolyngbya sp. FACHB-36]|uniref:HAD-IIB family hydrolase n=1 Tax=Leptolyngbya sp. FACHB-36 TaxID=2692808 RepID=UPI0016816660|nr:HAD family hydrolase [Leptolyngbya sp. FACHB-36]MBD2019462.1 HAD family phosphatase [Leptolyngbya sp. FACHB-36]
MAFTPVSAPAAIDHLKAVRLIATDMDGTLTIAGKFTAALLQAFERLAAAEIPVLIVTGRSAGWVSGLVNYLPVWGAIAENGGVAYTKDTDPIVLSLIVDLTQHRQQLAQVFAHLQTQFPQLQESTDNRFRLTDWTFDIAGLSIDNVRAIAAQCREWNWGFTYSTIQCHIKLPQQDKAAGVLRVLMQHFPTCDPAQVITVGDSPNDESLFDPTRFPLAVGVANVQEFADQLTHQPSYRTRAAEGNGFVELVDVLLANRGHINRPG